MIKVNDVAIEPKFFGDGTPHIKVPVISNIDKPVRIEWHYEPNEEMLLFYVKRHLDEATPMIASIYLVLPYIPNARMDRVKDVREVFTLKYFAEFINSMNFTRVFVDDPHSDVSVALIDRVTVQSAVIQMFQNFVLSRSQADIIVFPDAGAQKRYSYLADYLPVTHAIKDRDWETHQIVGFELEYPELVEDKNVVIIDDICSYGGTFLRTVEAVSAAGASTINLCVTHLENVVVNGNLIKSDKFDKIYTTNSIYTEQNDKVLVYK